MQPWKITLNGHGAADDEGDVVTDDGEVLGRWTVDYNEYYQFFPDGSEVHLFSGYRLGLFCQDITEWYEGQSAPNR